MAAAPWLPNGAANGHHALEAAHARSLPRGAQSQPFLPPPPNRAAPSRGGRGPRAVLPLPGQRDAVAWTPAPRSSPRSSGSGPRSLAGAPLPRPVPVPVPVPDSAGRLPESEKELSQLRAEETREWKNDIQSLKCALKQEEEKRLRVETLYEKTSETLRKKEDQYCKELEEKEQLELRSRNLEMELITLRKLLKEVEEERDETRRQLSQEKSARALQEELLNHHLCRQKELEEEARRTIEKDAELWKIALENKGKEVEGFLLASSGANTAIKQLEEHVQRLKVENAKLEATVQQQGNRIEALQRDLQTSASIHNRLEELITSLRTTPAAAEDHHHQQVAELSQQLEAQSKKCEELEAENQDLRDELSTMRENHQKLEKSKWQLTEEVANLKHRLETSMVDHSRIEQYKKEVEERAKQEIRHKLQEVNLFLQTHAACQDRLEQIRAGHHASLRKQLKHRIRDLECELDRIKNIQQDNIFQKESTQAEVKRYKELYLEEVKIRRCLANKLERANEKLAEANAHLLQERHRNKSRIASSIVSGGVAPSPVLYSTELGHLGNNLAPNGSQSPAGSTLSSRNWVEAYVAKVRRELDEKITKEVEQATAELKTGSTGASPVGSADRSSKNVHVDQSPLRRALREYQEILTKNYMIY